MSDQDTTQTSNDQGAEESTLPASAQLTEAPASAKTKKAPKPKAIGPLPAPPEEGTRTEANDGQPVQHVNVPANGKPRVAYDMTFPGGSLGIRRY